jgi:dihydroorotase-like cyclic amidohydrolase
MHAPALALALLALAFAAGGFTFAADQAEAKPPRWTERQAENALLSRAHISYADCLPLGDRGRRFQCLITYTDGGDWFLVLVPERDGYLVRNYERA